MWKCLIHRQYSLHPTCFINCVLEMFLPTSILVGLHEAWIPSYTFFLRKKIFWKYDYHTRIFLIINKVYGGQNSGVLFPSKLFSDLLPDQTASSLTKLFSGFQQVTSSHKPTSFPTHLSIP